MCVLVFLLFRRCFCSPCRSSSSRLFLHKLHPYYCRSKRDIANIQHITDRVISSAQGALAIIKSLVALNHGPLLRCPLHIYWLKSSLRERSGRRQPPAERSPCKQIRIYNAFAPCSLFYWRMETIACERVVVLNHGLFALQQLS